MKVHRIVVSLMILVLMFAIPRLARAQGHLDDPDTPESDKADAVVERHWVELMTIPHVEDVESDKKDGGEIVIKVGVDKKNVDEVARKIPPRLEGFAVDVVPAKVAQGDFAIFGLGEDVSPGDDGGNYIYGKAKPVAPPAESRWGSSRR